MEAFDQDTGEAGILAMVRQALAAQRVTLALQPVVMAGATEKISFQEGLVRIIDAHGRVIPAGFFIEAVETHELGRQIDCAALRLGLEALYDREDLRLSINLSPRSIGHPDWHAELEAGLAQDPTIAERLILEITESSAMTDPAKVQGFMADLRQLGISFALDDFGAGQTAFGQLRQFRFDIVKIDGQFCRDISGNRDNLALVDALTGLAQHFEMMIIAEHVANDADAEILAARGVDGLQGFHFGRPELLADESRALQRIQA